MAQSIVDINIDDVLKYEVIKRIEVFHCGDEGTDVIIIARLLINNKTEGLVALLYTWRILEDGRTRGWYLRTTYLKKKLIKKVLINFF